MLSKLRKFLGGDDHSMLAIVLPVVLITICILVRNLALAGPLLAGDEYAYYALSRNLRNIPALSARDPLIQLVVDPVFLVFGKLFFLISDNPDALLKMFNALAFSLSVFTACMVMHSLSQGRFPRYAPMIIALIPFSAYTAFFMPESLYVLIFLFIAAALIFLLPEHDLLATCLAGFLVGALLLTKANGASIFIATLLTLVSLVALPGKLRLGWKRALILVGLFVLLTYTSEVALNAAIMGKLSWDPMVFVGKDYTNYLREGADITPMIPLLKQIGVNTAGHLIILLFVCAIPIAHFLGWLLPISSPPDEITPLQITRSRRIYILIVFTFLATLITMALTINLTAYLGNHSPSQFTRLYGRYYSFVLFLYLIGYFILQEKSLAPLSPPGGWRLWGIISLIAAVLMFWVQRVFNIYPWDYPELFSTSLWSREQLLGLPIIMIGIIVYAFISIKPKLHLVLYPLFLFSLFIMSQFQVIGWQFERVSEYGAPAVQGRALRDLIPEADRSQGTVIGPDRYGEAAIFLFGFSSDPRVLKLPQGDKITMDMLPPGTDWVILLGKYDLDLPVKSSLSTDDVWLGWLSTSSPVIHERVEAWDGTPLDFKFGRGGGNTYMLDQFNQPEIWGTWSAADNSKIILPVLISGKLRIEMVGWINSESSAQQLNLILGSVSIPVQIGTSKGQICEIVDLPTPTRVITFHGINPVRNNLGIPPKAVALVKLMINRETDTSDAACPPYTPFK